MKELSIKEKAKRYDEAIEKFDVILNLNTVKESGTIFADDVRKILPELKEESEDERIKKALISILKSDFEKDTTIYDISVGDIIAWLEKQGEKKPADSVIEEEKPLLEKFKQAVYDCAWGKVTCKKEGETKEEYANRWAEHFLLIVRDWADDYIDFTIQQKLRNSYEKGKTDVIDKQGEQKSADKVEPKFHEGDWVVCCDYEPVQIISVRTNAYEMSNGDIRPFWMVDNNNNIRPWTTKYAKDGDVLADEKAILLFRNIGNRNWKNVISYYAILETNLNNRFSISDDEEYWGKVEDCELKPATKEQRDTLMKAMADAGYTFDFEKKELKKIEQKPAWSEDNEEVWNKAKQIFPESLNMQSGYVTGYKDAFKYFSLKKEWSEEDESMFRKAIITIDNVRIDTDSSEYYQDICNWLKLLKERYTWKPSDEQLKQLGKYCPDNTALTALYEQLKKLREE